MKQLRKKRTKNDRPALSARPRVPQKVLKSAILDHLTGLYNRGYLDQSLKKMVTDAQKMKKQFSLFMIDLDNFKKINDQHGHLAGDIVLSSFAKVLRRAVRKIDTCFRYGGDEFVILLPGADTQTAEQIIVRLKAGVETHKFPLEESAGMYLRLSVGGATFPRDGCTSHALIKRADEQLYKIKNQQKKQPGVFILRTKLVPPVLKENMIVRPRLLSLIKENLDKKLILVVGDAGYGKTTLLAQFVSDLKAPHVWLHVDKSDQHLDLFVRYLIEGIRNYLPDFGHRTLSVISHGRGQETKQEILVGTFINELLEIPEQKVVLLFDDLQEVYSSKEIVSGLEFLANHLPANVAIIIAARSNPPFSLERFQLKNETLDIDQQDLKFRRDEIAMLCKQVSGDTPKSTELEKLEADSEGWITCLQFLIQTSAVRPIFAKSRKALVLRLHDYFNSEVYTALDEHLKYFLAATSVFEYLLPEACDYLLSSNDAGHVLKKLAKNHLFISTHDAPQPSYVYHHLFRDFLINRLRELGSYEKLQNRAGMYWEQKGASSLALQHYVEANNFKGLARTIEKFGDDYLNFGKFEFVKHYLEYIPAPLVRNSPVLTRQWGKIYVWLCDWDRARSYYAKAQRIAQHQKNHLEVLKTIHTQLAMKLSLGEHKGVIRQIRMVLRSKSMKNPKLEARFLNNLGIALSFEGKPRQAINAFTEALHIAQRIDDEIQRDIALHNVANAYLDIGEFALAQNDLEGLVNRLRLDPPPLLITALSNLGYALMLQGNLTRAHEIYEEALKYARLFNDRNRQCMINYNLALNKMYAEEPAHAQELLAKAENLGLEIGHNLRLSHTWKTMAEVAIDRRDFLKAKRYIERALEIPLPLGSKAGHLITKAKIDLALNNLPSAEKTLAQALPHLTESKHLLMIYYFLMTRLCLLRKEPRAAKDFFERSIALAENNSYDFLFVYELKNSPGIIEFVKKDHPLSPYLQHLLLRLLHTETLDIFAEPDKSDYDFVFRLFGKLQIFKAGKEIPDELWRNRRFQELFAIFMINPERTLTREKIVGTFWPEQNQTMAKQLFYNGLYGIRKVVGKKIVVYNKVGYTLNRHYRYWVDTQEFERLINDADQLVTEGNLAPGLIEYEEACALYRSNFLEKYDSEWCQKMRRYFEDSYVDLLKKLAHGHYKIGNLPKTLKFCRLLLEKKPHEEDFYCLAIRCQAARNDTNGVQQTFSKLKKVLRQDRKTTPQPETIKLFEASMNPRP